MSDPDTVEPYATLLEIVAENPALTADDVADLAADRGVDGDVHELLETAVANNDVMEADGKHWIVRKGKYGYHEYDHPPSSNK